MALWRASGQPSTRSFKYDIRFSAGFAQRVRSRLFRTTNMTRPVNTTIRPATLADAPAIARYQIAMALETEDKQLDPQVVQPAVESVFADPAKGFYLVAEAMEQVIGTLMVTYEWSDWRNCNMWYIQSVFVDQSCRGQGVFKKLYQHVIDQAKQENVMFVRLYVETENERAQKVYESLGMKRMPYYMYDVKI